MKQNAHISLFGKVNNKLSWKSVNFVNIIIVIEKSAKFTIPEFGRPRFHNVSISKWKQNFAVLYDNQCDWVLFCF